MASPRMIQSQFGSLIYDSGVIPPLSIGPNAATVIFNEVPTSYMAVERHNDVLYVAMTTLSVLMVSHLPRLTILISVT
jgi:hypothetical protein